jgi:hypothetical protein
MDRRLQNFVESEVCKLLRQTPFRDIVLSKQDALLAGAVNLRKRYLQLLQPSGLTGGEIEKVCLLVHSWRYTNRESISNSTTLWFAGFVQASVKPPTSHFCFRLFAPRFSTMISIFA